VKKLTFFLIIVASIFCACKDSNQVSTKEPKIQTQKSKASSGLVHTVYFWLKADTSPEQRKTFEAALVSLGKVKSIDKYYWGKPAPTPQRDVVDHSYDYAINVFFKSLEDEASYAVDPDHDKFRIEFGPMFEKVIVYDNYFGLDY